MVGTVINDVPADGPQQQPMRQQDQAGRAGQVRGTGQLQVPGHQGRRGRDDHVAHARREHRSASARQRASSLTTRSAAADHAAGNGQPSPIPAKRLAVAAASPPNRTVRTRWALVNLVTCQRRAPCALDRSAAVSMRARRANRAADTSVAAFRLTTANHPTRPTSSKRDGTPQG